MKSIIIVTNIIIEKLEDKRKKKGSHSFFLCSSNSYRIHLIDLCDKKRTEKGEPAKEASLCHSTAILPNFTKLLPLFYPLL